jgi:hypothetical protein
VIDMPKYRVLKRCYLRPANYAVHKLCLPGEIVHYDGPPGLALEPIDDVARERFAGFAR